MADKIVVPCGRCFGTGKDFGRLCEPCGGTGAVLVYPSAQDTGLKCGRYSGTGKELGRLCEPCGGTGWTGRL